MERLLMPTKCWAHRIGISTTPDIREQRQLASAEEAREDRRQTYTEDARISPPLDLGNDFWRVRKLVRDGADPPDSSATLPKQASPGADVPKAAQVRSHISSSASTGMSSMVDPSMVLAPTPRPGLTPAASPLGSVVLQSGSLQGGVQAMPSPAPAPNGLNAGSLRARVM